MLIPSKKVGSGKSLLQVCVLAALGASPSVASAQLKVGADTGTASPRESDTALGDTADALPGIHRVGVAGLDGPRASSSFNLLYGFTEPQNDSSSTHHRLGGSLAASIAPWSLGAFGLRADFRHDLHASDSDGSDSGSVLDVTPHLRLGGMIGRGVHLGAEGRVKFPGATVGEDSGPDPEIDARALFAYSGVPAWVFALHGGYKLGHRGDVVTDAGNMRVGDRVALGVSQYDAILVGIGLVKAARKTEILGELTSEISLGSGAPGFLESPLRAAAGVRRELANNLWLSGLVEAAIGARPGSLPADPLAPIEPRVQAYLGITWRFLAPEPTAAHEPQKQAVPEAKKKEEPVKEGPQPATTSTIQVRVVDYKNHPISDAEVTIELPRTGEDEADSRLVPLDDRNVYVAHDVPVGEVEITVKADLLKTQTQTALLSEGVPTELEFKLEKADNVGSQLRGLVRSYAGEGLQASVRVEPGDQSTMCDEDGSFELELPPGVYKVIIDAEGYRSQRRTLRVRKEGVTVLNADLQKNSD